MADRSHKKRRVLFGILGRPGGPGGHAVDGWIPARIFSSARGDGGAALRSPSGRQGAVYAAGVPDTDVPQSLHTGHWPVPRVAWHRQQCIPRSALGCQLQHGIRERGRRRVVAPRRSPVGDDSPTRYVWFKNEKKYFGVLLLLTHSNCS